MVYNPQLYKNLYWINKMEMMGKNIMEATLRSCVKEKPKDFPLVGSND